jgi:uncharacterized protein YbjQ (UPF0145 family)
MIDNVAPASVQVIHDLQAMEYTEVGEIQVRWWGTRPEYDVLRDPAIQRALRLEAANLGADAVIQLRLITEPGGHRPDRWYPEPSLIKGISATAVRLKRGSSPAYGSEAV